MNTDVNITACPTNPTYYADINVKDAITKNRGNDTALTFTAGRNISVDADITSTTDKAGKLNITLNSNNHLNDKSKRDDGASIIKANIFTNGGNFTTTGNIGTYFGLKNYGATDGENAGTKRYVKTNGGAIHLGGDQVLLATGWEVLLDAGKGSVTIDGKVDSANVYRNEYVNNGNTSITWDYAVDKSQTQSGSHLAVITSRLEDAVVSSSIPKKNNETTEAYAGGHVIALPEGIQFEFVEESNGKPAHVILKDEQGNTVDTISEEKLYLSYAKGIKKFDENGKLTTVSTMPEGILKGYVMDNITRGWYKIDDNTLVRLWAWTAGKEIGKVFYVEALKITDDNNNYISLPESMKINEYKNHNGYKFKYYNTAIGYANFRPDEPNDNLLQYSHENALAVNYDTHSANDRDKVLYSQWDDIFEGAVTTGQNAMQNYVVESELAHTALNINAGETTIGGDIGNDTKLSKLTVASSANINLKGSVYVDNDVKTISTNNTTISGATNAGGLVELIAGDDARKDGVIVTKAAAPNHDISTGAITAGKTISMVADNDVTINGKIKSEAQNDPKAVEIIAQGNFYNKNTVPVTTMRYFRATVPEQAIQVGDGSAWKIYSDNPSDDLGNLNSNEFAVWSWGKAGFQYNADNDSRNRFIFKVTPEVIYKANDKTKVADKEMPVLDYAESYMLNGSALNGRFTANFKDGDVDALKSNYKLDQVAAGLKDGVTPEVEGEYVDGIELKNTANAKVGLEDFGYKTAFNPGTLTVTKAIIPEPQPKPQPKPQPESQPKPQPESQPEPQPQPQEKPQQTPQQTPQEKPQLDNLSTTNVDGSASYTTASRTAPGTDRVLGLQSAELPFFREELHQVKFYGTYDVSIDPDKVKMEPSAKVLPEPDQPQNQYREYDKELTTQAGTAKFKLTYNGSTFDIYPTDNASKSILLAGEVTKNVEVESQALFAAFKEMGIMLDDLNGVYIHFDNKSEVTSLLK